MRMINAGDDPATREELTMQEKGETTAVSSALEHEHEQFNRTSTWRAG